MIYCTTAPNDTDLVKALDHPPTLPLLLGDAWFNGLTTGGESILISVERKHAGDMASCVLSGRYLNQARTAKGYGVDVLILIVESLQLRPNPEDGLLEQVNWKLNSQTGKYHQVWDAVKPNITYSRFDQYLTELARDVGVIVKRTANVQETAAVIKALWVNFQTPPDEHNSLHQVYKQPRQGVLLHKPSLVRRIAIELKGVGWERSGAVAERFKTVREMFDATEKDWEGIEGIGKGIAKSVIAELRGQK